MVEGICSGFRMGFDYARVQCTPAKRNMASTDEHASIVTDDLQGEISQGCVCDPFVPGSWPQVQVSRFGMIPKSTQWHLNRMSQ